MNRNTISLAGALIDNAPKTLVIGTGLTYTTFDLFTLGSYQHPSGKKVNYHDVHHIICVGTLDNFARSIKAGAEIEVEGELRTRRHSMYIGDPAELQIVRWRKEVVATSIRPYMSIVTAKQEANADNVLIALYRPEEC